MTLGRLFIFSAPSGAGKSSLIQALLKTQKPHHAQMSISHTTRPIRPGEKHGEHYYFITHQKFRSMIHQKKFLEYAQVFGHYYGTSRQAVIHQLEKGIDIFLDIDWQGARNIRGAIPDARSIFILPPSKSELQRRLHKRDQDSASVITRRMTQAVAEISHYIEYNYLIVNENFDHALIDLQTIIRAESFRVKNQISHHKTLLNSLLVD
ncbi:guanylate kinase [Candidatus Erwinia haradaeae]|uniref:Guanylate kinase n=1 Tax=Candidatus Erwinia haradaeae TaxID=1922217 RepID=A0A451DAP7_9GAMM|nr:guanylate kinase [Candidatus Erwinia haradaeae]VFP83380.1 Guanylate kinase [Candidatus Erwinia haradaeae]